MKCSLEGNTAFMNMVGKTYHRFKLLEIISPNEIKTHFSFIHPLYDDGYQRIYFSENLEHMLERLMNQRCFLYKRDSIDENGETKWKIIKRIKNFPKDISECTYNNFLFSPDLMFYLDYDK
jgi:hypothetical protein